MGSQLKIGDIAVEVVRKDIKHAYLRVQPPAGEVRISAPRRMSNADLLAFARSRLAWIQQQQAKIRSRVPATPHSYVDGENLDVWGVPTPFRVSEQIGKPEIELQDGWLHLRMRPGTEGAKRQVLVEAWYRKQLNMAVPPLLARWEPVIGVKAKKVTLRQMKTRWGSCSHKSRTIRLNTELARQPAAYLEYVVVHELVHLLEPSHNTRFKALMDRFLPGWRAARRNLNQRSLSREDLGC